jgi:wyosine [tRNA(Phe)-imidazoG37] synthetase (radical SAM superfamily)
MRYLKDRNKMDFITFSGAGEPTLNSEIGKIIREIKSLTEIPVAVLTNATLLDKSGVRDDLLDADLILPSLDAVTPEIFRKINRPTDGIEVDKIIEGLIKFRYEYKSKIWLEVFILNGINSSKDELLKLYKTILKINPDKVQLNTLDRPPAYENIVSTETELLEKLREDWKLLPNVEIIKRVRNRNEILSFSKNLENNILNLIIRHPITVEELSNYTGKSKAELYKYIDILIKEKKIIEKIIWGKIFLIKNKGGRYV